MIVGLAFALLFAFGWIATAGTDVFNLARWTIAGGGAASTGDDFSLSGIIGQHDAGMTAVGSGYQVTGGFGSGRTQLPAPRFATFLPILMNSS